MVDVTMTHDHYQWTYNSTHERNTHSWDSYTECPPRNGSPQSDGVLNHVVRTKIRHYRQIYEDRIRLCSCLLSWTPRTVYTMTVWGWFSWMLIVRLVLWMENCPRNLIGFVFLHSACLGNRKDSVGLILGKTESFHTSPSLHSLSSRPLSSRSFPSPISSTLCLSGTWCAFIL
jgi:hypothetical protein